jgi:hypothetical protein
VFTWAGLHGGCSFFDEGATAWWAPSERADAERVRYQLTYTTGPDEGERTEVADPPFHAALPVQLAHVPHAAGIAVER